MKHGSELLRLWREERNLSQIEAAGILGVTYQQVSHWECRQHRPNGDRRTEIEKATDGDVPAASWKIEDGAP